MVVNILYIEHPIYRLIKFFRYILIYLLLTIDASLKIMPQRNIANDLPVAATLSLSDIEGFIQRVISENILLRTTIPTFLF